ncbi:MAG: chemotaxis protein CheW [Deltaproteobacteria bacterium]|nr:MAG: chemotaxis protein CheW [Deltaproteobacteria bacterium]
MSHEQLYSTFALGEHYFGVDVNKVQEIIRYQNMTPVPLAEHVIRGLINLRGQIVTAMDLRRRMEMDDLPEGKKSMNVVIRTDDGAISLLVDEIGDVISVDDQTFEECPETLKGVARDLIKGAYKLENKLLLILDTQKVCQLNTVQ